MMTSIRKLFCTALVLAIMLLSLTGCGDKPYEAELLPDDADLMLAPSVILESTDGQDNLGGWTGDDEVSWYFDLPAAGEYTFEFVYSLRGDYSAVSGCVEIESEDGSFCSEDLEFAPTSADGDWSTYKSVSMSAELEKGSNSLYLYPYDLPEGQENFINLRKVIISSGKEAQKPAPSGKANAAGWWVRPEGYESEGISLVDIFHVEDDMKSWTVYNTYGAPGDTRECTFEDHVLTIDIGFDLVDFKLDGDRLLSSDDGEVEFVRVSKPDFVESNLGMDGKWYRYGDKSETHYYEIQGNTLKKYQIIGEDKVTERETTFKEMPMHTQIGDYSVPEYMELYPDDMQDSLIPSSKQKIFLEAGPFNCEIYVHESVLDEGMIDTYKFMSDLTEMDLRGYPDDTITYSGKFDSAYFYFIPYKPDGQGNLVQQPDAVYGQWSFEKNTLILEFQDGTEERIQLPEPEGILYVDKLKCEFQLPPVF